MGVKLRERHAYITRKQTFILHIQLLFALTPHSYSYELERTKYYWREWIKKKYHILHPKLCKCILSYVQCIFIKVSRAIDWRFKASPILCIVMFTYISYGFLDFIFGFKMLVKLYMYMLVCMYIFIYVKYIYLCYKLHVLQFSKITSKEVMSDV